MKRKCVVQVAMMSRSHALKRALYLADAFYEADGPQQGQEGDAGGQL